MAPLTNIPTVLAARPQWVLWKTVERDGKPTKVPYQTTGAEAKSNDPATWTTLEAAAAAFDAGGYDGIGYVFSSDDPFVGIDLDGCRDSATNQFSQWAREIIIKLNTYSEVSPSGTGVKLIGVGTSPFSTGKNTKVAAEAVCEKQPGIEIYSQLRYFAITGRKLQGLPAEPQPCDLQWIADQYFPKPKLPPRRVAASPPSPVLDRAFKYVATMPGAVSGSGGHNQTFTVACRLVLGFGLSTDDAMRVMQEYNRRCEPPWSERELVHKIESAGEQPGERNYLRNVEPSRWSSVTIPEYEEPERLTLEDATRKYFERVRNDDIKLFSLGLPELDYAIGGGVEKGEVVILAARPSHGKSAVALQFIHDSTANGLACIAISEEMSAMQIGGRTLQFATETKSMDWRRDIANVERDIDNHFEKRAECYIIESCSTYERAVYEVERAIDEHGVEIAIVDYVQLLLGKGTGEREQISNASKAMKAVAKRRNIILIELCQMNRAIDSRPRWEPTMRDLDGSSQLEKDADVILFLCWPWMVDHEKDKNVYKIFVAKNRNREIKEHVVACTFNPQRQMLVSSNPYRGDFAEWEDCKEPETF